MLIKNDKKGAAEFTQVANAASTLSDHVAKLIVSGLEV